jgi:cell division protein FtsZ
MIRRDLLQLVRLAESTCAIPRLGNESANAVPLPNTPTETKSDETSAEVDRFDRTPKVAVIAIGGAGGVILTRLSGKLPFLDRTIAIDVNPFGMEHVVADQKILIGDGKHRPRRADTARFMAATVHAEIANAVANLDLVLLIVGMGGVAGSAISQTFAEVLQDQKILSIAFAITPFDFEGPRRQKIASSAMKALSKRVDVLIPFSNELYAGKAGLNTSVTDVLNQVTESIEMVCKAHIRLVCEQGLVGVDFEDIRTVLAKAGQGAVGIATATGGESVMHATVSAVHDNALGIERLRTAKGVLIYFEGAPPFFKIRDASNALNFIKSIAKDDVHIVFGAFFERSGIEHSTTMILAIGSEQY